MRARLLPFALILGALPLSLPGLADAPRPRVAPAHQSLAARVELTFERFVLPNGLEVILHEDHRTPIVAVSLDYHVGSKDDPPGKSGVAHLFEHVMYNGSRNVPAGMFEKYLAQAGVSASNGSTNVDVTSYYETLPASELALALWLESDRMASLLDRLDQASFDREREVVKNERRQRYENSPYGLVVPVAIRNSLYPEGHPYHNASMGVPAELDAASLDDVRAFFKRYYVPGNASLVIAGDIQKPRARELVERYFGRVPKGADPAAKRAPMPVSLASEVRIDVEADVELSRVYVVWPTVTRYAPGSTELDLLSMVLSLGKSSRLHKRLVYDLQIAQAVSADADSALLAGVFYISVLLKKDTPVEKVLKEIDAELAKMQAGGPTEEEMERARSVIIPNMLFGLEAETTRAAVLNNEAYFAGDPGYLSKHLAQIEALAPADLKAAAQKLLPLDRRLVAVVTPTPGAPKGGRLVKRSKP
ncbi:MAG: pitrilysin family protein [Byssovorax sp.]